MKTEVTAKEQLKTPPVIFSYGVAVLSVVVAFILAKADDYYFHSQPFALLFLSSILFSAWFGGFGPALVAVALSLLVFAYYFVNQAHMVGMSLNELPRLIIFAVIGVTVGFLTASQRSITAALRRSEARKTAILDSALDCFVTIDHEGCITEFNPAAERTFGYRREEVVGKQMADVIIPPSLREGHRLGFARYLATGEGQVLGRRIEMTAVRADGSEFPVEIAITRIPLEGPPTFTGYVRDITERKRAEGELRHSREQLRALTGRLETLREAERTRIAREIHDELGQNLTGLKMDLLWMEQHLGQWQSLPAANAILDRVGGATELVDGIICTVQEIAAELRPSVLDKLGLGTALQYEARRFQDRAGIPCEVRIPETELALTAEVSTAFFRVFQESLTNVARHAHATKVEAELKAEPQALVLRLRDNGDGITEADIANPQSFGLLGMKERVAHLGGEVVFQSHPGQGTLVTVRVPTAEAAPASQETV
jgi:two-component system sensor histidine kinase UhpB